MRFQTVLLLGCLGSFSAVGQQAVKPASSLAPDSMTPEKLLAFALAHNGAGEIPGEGWHIKATFEASTGKEFAEFTSGTYEETWYAPENYKRTYTYKGVTHTDYGTPDGVFREGDPAWPTPQEERVRALLVAPLPSDPLSTSTTLRTKDTSFGKFDLPCLYELKSMPSGLKKKDEDAFIDRSPRMCFESNAPILRLFAGIGSGSRVELSKIVNLHGHLVAQEIVASNGDLPSLKIHVVEASFLGAPSAPLQPAADAVKLTSPVTLEWESIAPNRLPDPPEPIYPAGALQEKTFGDVNIALVIAPDGTVTSAKVVDGMPMLRDSALDFVKKSKFKPFLLSGTPVEVHTVAHITFDEGMARRQFAATH